MMREKPSTHGPGWFRYVNGERTYHSVSESTRATPFGPDIENRPAGLLYSYEDIEAATKVERMVNAAERGYEDYETVVETIHRISGSDTDQGVVDYCIQITAESIGIGERSAFEIISSEETDEEALRVVTEHLGA